MARKIRRQESSSDDDDNSSDGGDDSSTEDSSTTISSSDDNGGSPTPTSPSLTSTRTLSPADASTTQNSPTPTSINSSDIVSTSGGQTVYITTTNGQTETLTVNAQSTSVSSSEQSNSSALSTGATAGIAVGVVMLILIAAALVFLLYRKRKRSSQRTDRDGWNSKASDMSSSNNDHPVAARVVPNSGEQTLQSFGYGGTAELHNEDKAVETGGRPVYEMSGSIPENRGPEAGLQSTGAPPEYTPRATEATSDIPEEDAGPVHDVISPLSDSATYAPGDLIVSPIDSKTRQP